MMQSKNKYVGGGYKKKKIKKKKIRKWKRKTKANSMKRRTDIQVKEEEEKNDKKVEI